MLSSILFTLSALAAIGMTLTAPASTLTPGEDDGTESAPAPKETPSWAGVYTGVFPAEKSPGFEIRLTLSPDGSCTIVSRSLMEGGEAVSHQGMVRWLEQGRCFAINVNGVPILFEIEGEALIRLSPDGKRLEGEAAGHQRLNREK